MVSFHLLTFVKRAMQLNIILKLAVFQQLHAFGINKKVIHDDSNSNMHYGY